MMVSLYHRGVFKMETKKSNTTTDTDTDTDQDTLKISNLPFSNTTYAALRAYNEALDNERGSKALQRIACQNSTIAYLYAMQVDGKPCKKTREAACSNNPRNAYMYARDVDRAPSYEAFIATRNDPKYQALYDDFETKYHKIVKSQVDRDDGVALAESRPKIDR